jgi:hypothetical protein
MQVEGKHLFGIQWIMPRALPVGPPIKAISYLVPRLATSVDGGHNWTIIDNQFASQRLGVLSYTVDPNNSNTIYDLIRSSLLPINLRSVPTYDPVAVYGINQELFKTTDGGATWQSILKNIPYASQVQLAAGNPQLIYVGGAMDPIPLLPGVPGQSYPFEIGSFHLQMSTNGGLSWQTVTKPTAMQNIQNWFVSSVGQAYTSPTIPFSNQPTVITGTVQPSTPLPFPTSAPQSGIQGVPPVGSGLSRPATHDQPTSFIAINVQAESVATSPFIRRYDPNTHSWNNVTSPPTVGFMLQLTSLQSSSVVMLWFVGMSNYGVEILYRYVV